MESREIFDVVVAGGGPAGLSAALVLARARRHVLVLDDRTYRNARVAEFHGFPGRDATDPTDFRADVVAELTRYDIGVDYEPVTTASVADDVVDVAIGADREVAARRVLIATGVADELPDIEGLDRRWGKSAFNCPFCDGWEHRDRQLVVLDAAPGADDLAKILRSWTSDVKVVASTDVLRLVGDGTDLEAVELQNGDRVRADAVFVRAPVRPRNGLAKDLGCELDEDGFILTSQEGATSNALAWAAGDIRRPPPLPHQVVLAAADGSAAAISIHKSLMD